MKFLLFIGLTLSFTKAMSAELLAAYSGGDKLIVIVSGDNCNSYFGSLKPSKECAADRGTRNYAINCESNLGVGSTRMACSADLGVPHALEFSLSKSNIAPEAKHLTLNYGQQKITVELNQ